MAQNVEIKVAVADLATLRAAIEGIGARWSENVRFHLDRVEGLSTFLELEAVVDAMHDEATCRAQVDEIVAALGLDPAMFIRASYADLLTAP